MHGLSQTSTGVFAKQLERKYDRLFRYILYSKLVTQCYGKKKEKNL